LILSSTSLFLIRIAIPFELENLEPSKFFKPCEHCKYDEYYFKIGFGFVFTCCLGFGFVEMKNQKITNVIILFKNLFGCSFFAYCLKKLNC
jgi:hypothetical protein